MSGTGITYSDNLQGNDAHYARDGKFAPKDAVGSASSEDIFSGLKKKEGTSSFKEFAKKRQFELQTARVPKLRNADEIIQSIPLLLSEKVVATVDSLFNYDNKGNLCDYEFKITEHVSGNAWTFPLGKLRYKNNYAQIVSEEEFNKYLTDQDFNNIANNFTGAYRYPKNSKVVPLQPVFRGLENYSRNDKMAIVNLIQSYGNKENVGIYGGGNYGSNVYTTVSRDYAEGYDGSYGDGDVSLGHLIKGILDTRDSYYMTDRELGMVKSSLLSRSDDIQSIVEKEIGKYLTPDKTSRLAKSFMAAIRRDLGMVGILMGVDFIVSENHQRNILNLGRWIIKDDFSKKGAMYGY